MFGRRYYQARYATSPSLYGPSLFNPFRGLLGGSLMIAGMIVILHVLAPQMLEQALPDWKIRYGGIIVAAVIFGFIRSVFRLFLPLAALGFWIVAVFALIHTSMPTSFTLPKIPSITTQASQPQSATTAPSVAVQKVPGSKSLPDSAYFPAQKHSRLAALSNIPGVSWLKELFR